MPAWLLDLFASYSYAVVFAGVFLENMGLPVPGETALLAGAALAHFGELSLGRVIATGIAAAILGDRQFTGIEREHKYIDLSIKRHRDILASRQTAWSVAVPLAA